MLHVEDAVNCRWYLIIFGSSLLIGNIFPHLVCCLEFIMKFTTKIMNNTLVLLSKIINDIRLKLNAGCSVLTRATT